MIIYTILVLAIVAGQIALDMADCSRPSRLSASGTPTEAFSYNKKWRKAVYCASMFVLMTLISGLRDIDVGMWDTASVYLPAYKIISSKSLAQIAVLGDTQYHFQGYVLYSKFLSLISSNPHFYVFMTAWPFFLTVSILIYKRAERPGISFMSLLGFCIFTYSFSMIRGMLSMAFLVVALDSFLDEKRVKFCVLVLIASTFHITALAFLILLAIDNMKWSFSRFFVICCAMLALRTSAPKLWFFFVKRVIAPFLPQYAYYGNAGGALADVLLLLYVFSCFAAWLDDSIFARDGHIVIRRRKRSRLTSGFMSVRKRKKELSDFRNRNLLMGMSVCACAILYMTFFLPEMLRIAMLFSLGTVLLNGRAYVRKRKSAFMTVYEMAEYCLFAGYFLLAALPNANAVPYSFFW